MERNRNASTVQGLDMHDVGRHDMRNRERQMRSMRPVLIGAGLAAAALGLFQVQRRARNDGQMGKSGQMGRHASGTREAKKQTLLAWLNDAYAMERGIAQDLKAHASDAKHHPMMRQRLQQHVEETRRHAELVKERIESLGGSISTFKSGLSTVMGAISGAAPTPAKDSLVKEILSDSAAEQLEIASYRGIITAAEEIGDSETARVAREILREEEAMLEWFQQQLPHMVRDQMTHA